MAKIDVTGFLQSLGVNVTALEEKGINFLLGQAATWSRVPTRFRRVSAAIDIVIGAATQQNRTDVLAEASAARSALSKLQQVYDATSGDVADVVDIVRGLAPGQLPPVEITPKVAKAAAAMASVLKGITAVESGVHSAASRVLTPAQMKQLESGLSFPSFMAGQVPKLLLYALFAVPVYFVLVKRTRKRRRVA